MIGSRLRGEFRIRSESHMDHHISTVRSSTGRAGDRVHRRNTSASINAGNWRLKSVDWLVDRDHQILMAEASLPDDPSTVVPVAYKVSHELRFNETEHPTRVP